MKYNDYQINQTFVCPPTTLTLKEIKDFAKKYVPLPIHLDSNHAQKNRFNEIIASGFHTLIATWAQWTNFGHWDNNVIAGVGLDEVLWKN